MLRGHRSDAGMVVRAPAYEEAQFGRLVQVRAVQRVVHRVRLFHAEQLLSEQLPDVHHAFLSMFIMRPSASVSAFFTLIFQPARLSRTWLRTLCVLEAK